MRRTVLALPLALLTLTGALTTQALTQDAKKVSGTLTAITPSMATVQVAGNAMNFVVDGQTKIEAPGAGTATRRAEAAGKPGVAAPEVIKTGQAVEVSYRDVGGTMHATLIRRVSSVGGAPGESTSASGKVASVSASSLTISGSSGGGATFTQTYVIDANTRVVGKGAGTASRAGGGKAPITAMVAKGDSVSVSFRKMGDALHATDVTVTMKATK